MLEMAQRPTFADGISHLSSPQDKWHRSDQARGDSSLISPLSFAAQVLDLPIRLNKRSVQESKYRWPSRDNNLEARMPFATKDEEPLRSAGTRNESIRRKKRSHSEDENPPSTRKQKRIKLPETPPDEQDKADETIQKPPRPATCELQSLARSLADDTPLGQLLEHTFTEWDARMKEKEQSLAMIRIAAPVIDRSQGKEAEDGDYAGPSAEEYGFDFEVINGRIWNVSRRMGSNPAKISPKLTVWRD